MTRRRGNLGACASSDLPSTGARYRWRKAGTTRASTKLAGATVSPCPRRGNWRNAMRDGPSNLVKPIVSTTSVSRRLLFTWTARLAGGAAFAATVSGEPRWAQSALAADDEIVLTGAASEVGAKPGSGYAQAAAAFSAGDSEAGGIAVGAANAAVAPAGGGGSGGGSGSGPGDSSGEGPGGGGGTGGGGAGPGDSSGAGPGSSNGMGGGGTGGGTGSGPGNSDGSGPGDQSGGGGY